MTQLELIAASMPLYFQCLSVPVRWQRAMRETTTKSRNAMIKFGLPPALIKADCDLLAVKQLGFQATSFDAWAKRTEFFRLREGDTDGLLGFLRSVGVFSQPTIGRAGALTKEMIAIAGKGLVHITRFTPIVSEAEIWVIRRGMQNLLREPDRNTGQFYDFQVRMMRVGKDAPRAVLTTTTFLDSLLLTLSVDRAMDAKVQKCARPDCGVSFSSTGARKRKYCTWDCGHLESVRRQRRKVRRTSTDGKK
jgi:hypothetical protein